MLLWFHRLKRGVQRLRATGVIEREGAILSPELDAGRSTILALLRIARNNAQRIGMVTEKFLAFDSVERIFSVTGDNDIAMIRRVASMQDFADFAVAQFYTEPIIGFESLVAVKEYHRPD